MLSQNSCVSCIFPSNSSSPRYSPSLGTIHLVYRPGFLRSRFPCLWYYGCITTAQCPSRLLAFPVLTVLYDSPLFRIMLFFSPLFPQGWRTARFIYIPLCPSAVSCLQRYWTLTRSRMTSYTFALPQDPGWGVRARLTLVHCCSHWHQSESLSHFVIFRGSITRLLYSLSTLHKSCRQDPCKTCFQWFAKSFWMKCVFSYSLH